jgi:hypothetical protein
MQQVYFLFALLSHGYLIDDYCVIHLASFIIRVNMSFSVESFSLFAFQKLFLDPL